MLKIAVSLQFHQEQLLIEKNEKMVSVHCVLQGVVVVFYLSLYMVIKNNCLRKCTSFPFICAS